MLFVHPNWVKSGLYEKLAALAQQRSLADMTCGPVMTWTTEAMLVSVQSLWAHLLDFEQLA